MAEKKTRVQLDFTPATMAIMERVKERLDAASRTETIRRALRFLDYVTKATKDGELVLQHPDGSEKVIKVL